MSNTGHLPELESLRSQVADLTRELAARDQSMQVQHQSLDHVMQDLRAQSDLLKAIMEGTAADTGDEFFASLATRLTASLHMQYAVIGEIVDGTPMTIRTVAVASEGTLLDNFEYDLTQAPCGTGLTKSFWCYEQGVQALFPNFPPLATLGVDSHSGVSIRNKQGNAVGVIVVMDTKPITNPERLQALLYVFAPRVAAELQRRHTETELQEQTQRLAHAQTLAHLGSWDWEIGSGRMGWSDEQFRIFGHEPGLVAATHETFLAALLPDDHDRVLAAMNATLVNQAPFDLECRIVRPSGEVRVIHVRGDVHRDATGHPLSMAGTVLDITERKQVEETLRASEERWHLAVRGSNDGIWDWNVQTGEIFFSTRWKAMRGFGDYEIKNHVDEWRSRIHPDDLDRVLQSIDAYLAQQAPELCEEYRVQRKDGSYMWILDRGVALWADDGTPLRMAGSETDITERKRTEETLRQSEERYHTLAETLPVGIFRTDREGSYLYVNKRWCEIAGLSHEKALNHGWVDATHPEDRQDVIEEWHRAIIRQEMFSSEYRFQRGHGATTWVLCQAVTEKDSHGETIGYIGTITDITKRKWAEQTLRRSEWDLRTVLDALPVGVWFTDATGKVRLTNPAGLRIWADVQQVGLESTEGHPGWWENVSSSGEPHRWALARALTKGKATLNEELSIQCLDGTRKVIINSAVALFGENGQVSGAIIVNQDITERKTLERDQAQTQAFLQSILENIPHTITVKDAKTLKIVQMNRAAEQVLKLDRHVLTDKTLYDCLPEGEANALWAADMDALQRRTLVEVPEHVVKREGEPDRIFRTKKAPIFDAAGEPQYILSISEDITERTTAETSRRQRAEHIIRFQQARLRLTKVDHVDRAAAWRTITETAGSALGVERVSIWLFNEDRSAIVCRDLYELSTQSHEQGALLDARHYPKYFEALASDVALATSDARTDPRTDEFRERYLPLFGITSMMDAPIHLHGNVAGVLCHEHTGPPREWTSEEQSFAASVADQVALSLEAEERALAETALRSTKNHLQAILDHSPAVIFVKDTEGHYLLINRRYEELHQVSSNEVIGKTDYDIFDRDTADGLRSNDRKVLQTGCPLSLEETVPVENGILTVISTKFPLKDANGRPYAVCGITTDITERKRVEEALAHLNATLEQQVAERTQALRESEERHRTLFKSSRDAMMTLAPPTWNFTSGNPATVSMFHTKDEAEFISLSPWNLSPERQPDGQLSVDKAKKMIDAAMREGSHFFEWTHKHITGEEFPATVLLTRTVLGGQPQLQATVRDITEQKKVEAAVAHLNTTLEQQVAERTHALRQREEDLKRAIEEREQISQDLHDGILQSLFAIGLTLETSKSMMSPRKRKISGPPLDQAIDQLNRVMHEIRNFIAGLGSDLLQGKDLPTALQHMLDSLTQNHATRVRLTIEDRAAQAVSAEQSLHLLLVIQEAVSNCIRHGHAQEATVSLKMLKQGVRLNIRDNGRGFNPDVAKGTGHGLSNMAARAQKIGGRFTVLSKVNEGTRIVLDLPKEASSVRR